MKINRLDAHDRYQHLTNQSFDIGECCQDLINKRPFGEHAFYIFAHPRTLGFDEKLKLAQSGRYKTFAEIPEKTLIWQPRLTKPKAQENSMLFKANPNSDIIRTIWILPPRELWSQYDKDKMTQNKTVYESIQNFLHHKEKLESPEDDDLPEHKIDAIYKELSRNAKKKKDK